MEALQLLWVGLATVVFVAVVLGRRTGHAPYAQLLPTIDISDPAVVQRMLFDHANAFSNRPTSPFPLDFAAGRYGGISTVPHGPAWRVLRRSLTADILHPTRLGLVEPLQRDVVASFISGLSSAAQSGDLVAIRPTLRPAMYTLMMRQCFGDDGFDVHDVRAMDRAQMEFLLAYGSVKAIEASRLPRFLYRRRWLRFDAAFNRLSMITISLIAASRRRRQARGECSGGGSGIIPYVDSLLDLRVPGDGGESTLTDKEMAPLVWEFIVAGAESVLASVEWTLAHLVAQPEVQDKLRGEVVGIVDEHQGSCFVIGEEHLRSMPYLRAVILESLRMHPPLSVLSREAAAGAAAAAGVATTTANSGSGRTATHFRIRTTDIGRNGEAWTDPDVFRPERFLAGGEGEGVGPVPGPKEIKMLPFGAGRRYCPGVGMGMAHIGCLVATAVREFEWAPPSSGAASGGVDLTQLDIFFNVMKTPLTAHITPRSY